MKSHGCVETSNVSDSPSRSSNGKGFSELQREECRFCTKISDSARKVKIAQTCLCIL